MAKYMIRTKKQNGTASLYTRFQKFGKNILLNTKVSVNIVDWNNSQSSVSKWKSYINTPQGAKVNELLTKIDAFIDSLPFENYITADYLSKRIADIVGYEAQNIIREKRESEIKAEKEYQEQQEQQRKNNILLYLDTHISNLENGFIKNKSGHDLKKSTIKNWKTFRKVLEEYLTEHYFTWQDINQQNVYAFVRFMEQNGYLDNTINAFLAKYGALVSAAFMDEYHENARASKFIGRAKKIVKSSDKRAEIYLNENEVEALFNMELSGKMLRVRDLFLIGVYTCQRFSDYSRLSLLNIEHTTKGNDIIQLTQVKTQNAIAIPILYDNLRQLLERNVFPKKPQNLCYFNYDIRKILKELSVNVTSLCQLIETIPTKEELKQYECYGNENKSALIFENGKYYKPKWALVSSHTARRTGITILYLSGKLDIVQLMAISGHKTPEILLEYIKLSNIEKADEIADKMRSETKQKHNKNITNTI